MGDGVLGPDCPCCGAVPVRQSCGGAVSIGEILAQSRQRAGLSVARVSEQTRIRERIIRGVEDDDYSACGGDFYARGHIRAIATAVGTDPGPLIREYDRVYRAPGAVWTVRPGGVAGYLGPQCAAAPAGPARGRGAGGIGLCVGAAPGEAARGARAGGAGTSGSGAPGEPGRGAGASAGGGAWFRDLPRPVRLAACGGGLAGGREPCGGREPRGGWPSLPAGHTGPGAEDRPCSRGTGHSTGHASAGADPRPRRSGWPGRAGAIPSWPVR